MSEEKSSISMSRKTRHKSGWLAKSPRPSLGTPRLAFGCETATLRMVRPSAIVSRRWRSRRSSPRRDRHGRMPTSSASSARSAANVSITSSSSTSVTCAECCRHTLSITTEAERISRSARIVRSLGPYSHPLLAPLSPFQRSAACTIATSVPQPEWFAVAQPAQPSRCRVSSRPAIPRANGIAPRTVAWVSGRRSGQHFGRMIKKRLPHASSANRSQSLLDF
ncbi:MAG: hypothetical protein QOJ15_2243 [Bradyrhizobium sp.]|nr:hypothetical protein [Bradyrhizobium sp.]